MPAPWLPVKYKQSDVSAIQALRRGDATPEQQHHAMQFIIEVICMKGDMSFRPGGPEGDRDTAFAEGRRYCGNQIVKLATIPLSKLNKDTPK